MSILYKTFNIYKFDEALKNFDNHLDLEGKSISTRKNYTRTLYFFIAQLNKLPEECNKNEIIDFFITSKNEKQLYYSSLRNYMHAIKYYLKNVVSRMDLFETIPNPVNKKYVINVLNIHEITLLFKSCKNIREQLILQLFYETGMRVSELVNLSIDDIDFYYQSITVRNSKNRKTRTINFGKNLLNTLSIYIKSTQSLFTNCHANRKFHRLIPLSKRSVSRLVNSIVQRTNIRKRVNLHCLRHTFAVHYLNFGGTIYQLQKLLGHSFISSTIHYLQYAVLPESKHISILDKTLELDIKHDFYLLRA